MLYDTVLVIEEMMMLVKYPSLLNVYSNGNAQAAYAGGFNTSTKASKTRACGNNEPNDVLVVIVFWTYLRWSSCTANCGSWI
jgi:hypothetical protein